MALLFMDGFDHYVTAADIGKKWTTVNGALSCSPVFSRSPGGFGMSMVNGYVVKSIAQKDTFIFGAHLYILNSATARTVFVFRDTGSEQISIRTDNSNHFLISRNGTTLATSTNTFLINTWYHVELKATIHNTAGAYELRVNGTSTGWIPAATGANTRATANNYINEFYMSAGSPTLPMYFDDVYILDSTAPNNDFLGPQKIITAFPAGAGNYAQFTPNWMTNHLNVSAVGGGTDDSFNQSSTANQIDSFDFDNVPSGTINAIQHVILARQDTGTQRSLAPLQRRGGTDTVGGTVNVAGTYLYYLEPQDVDPQTAAQWTASDFNSSEFGYKLIA